MNSAVRFSLLIFLCLLPWFAVQSQLSLNGNTIWLVTAAERLLAGEHMAETFYEVNPPLSILYHLPPVIVGKLLTAVPVHYIILSYFLILIGLSGYAVNRIAGSWTFLEDGQRRALLAAWLAGNTILATIALGERDQVVLLGLMPFMMAQLCLSWRTPLPARLFWPVMVCGVVAVLIKPHFGLLPVLLLAHRMIVQKRLWIIRDPDFLALAAGTIGYVAFIGLFFRDYLQVILPDVLSLYVVQHDYSAALLPLLVYGFMFLIVPLADIILTPLQGRAKTLLILLYAGALFGLVPYAVQMKGFFYHLLPSLILFVCALGLSVYGHLGRLKKLPAKACITGLLIFLFAYALQPPLLAYPTHADYRSLPLNKVLASCERPCPVLMFHDSMEVMHPALFYNGQVHASRFPTFWFLPSLLQQDGADRTALRRKYAAMTGQDLARYQPRMALIGQYHIVPGSDEPFDFAGYFSIDEGFSQEWAQYDKVQEITVNLRPYYAGTPLERDTPQTYDVYIRKRSNR